MKRFRQARLRFAVRWLVTLPLSGEHQAEIVGVWTPRHQASYPQRHLVTIGLTLRMLHQTPLDHAERWEQHVISLR